MGEDFELGEKEKRRPFLSLYGISRERLRKSAHSLYTGSSIPTRQNDMLN